MASDTNRVALSFVEEVTFGTSPTTAQTSMRYSSESLAGTQGTAQSAEIRSDRQIVDIIKTSGGSAGDINAELHLGGSINTLLKSALQTSGATSEDATSSLTLDVTSGTGTYDSGATSITSGWAVGEWVKISGCTNAANNGLFKIASIVDNFETSVAGACTIAQGAYWDNETTQVSYTIEKDFEDLTNTLAILTGQVIDGFNLSVPQEGVVTCGFTFMGKSMASATATVDASGHVADTTGSILSSLDVSRFTYNRKEIPLIAFNLSMVNNSRGRKNIGDESNVSVGAGACVATGSFQAYFDDDSIITDIAAHYEAGTSASLAIGFTKSSADLLIALSAVRLTSATRVAGGQNQDVIMEVGFECFRDATLDNTIRITEW